MIQVKYMHARISDLLSIPLVNVAHKSFDSKEDAISELPKEKLPHGIQYIELNKEIKK